MFPNLVDAGVVGLHILLLGVEGDLGDHEVGHPNSGWEVLQQLNIYQIK